MTGMQIFRGTLIVLGTLVLAALFAATLNVWIVLWIAILIASAVRPAIEKLKKLGLSQGIAIPIVYGFILVSAFVLILLVLPPVVNQFTRYLQNDNLLVNKIVSTQRWFENGLSSLTGDEISLGFDRAEIAEVVDNLIRELEVTAPSLVGNIGAFIGDFILIFVMGIYWITSRRRAEEFLVGLLPIGRQAQARAILDEIEHGLGGYVRGIVLVSVIVGGLSFVSMQLLDTAGIVRIPNAASLSFFYGLATAIPIVGGLIGVALATVLAFLTASPATGFAVFAVTVLLQQVENYFISPRIMASSSSFDEILVIVFIAAGFTLDGITGGLIAIPVAATAAILLKHLIIVPRKDKVIPTRVDGGIVLTTNNGDLRPHIERAKSR